jgi:hypothetical protein
MNKRGNLPKKSDDHAGEYSDEPSFWGTAVSRASYVRAIDLFDGFGKIFGSAESTFTGLGMTLFGGAYRAVTRVVVPFSKLVIECNSRSAVPEASLNALDFVTSSLSFVSWIVANTGSGYANQAADIEKYLLFASIVFHMSKDTMQKYNSANAKSPQEKKIDQLEKGLLKLNGKFEVAERKIESLEEKTPELLDHSVLKSTQPKLVSRALKH